MPKDFLSKLKNNSEKEFKKIEVEETKPAKKEKPIECKKEEKCWIEQDGQPAMDMYQQETELIIQAALAGIQVSDVEISIENDIFMIKGKRDNPAKEVTKHFLQECFWGNFSREIILPLEVDASRTEAEIKNGVLIIKIPIVEKSKKKIDIKK